MTNSEKNIKKLKKGNKKSEKLIKKASNLHSQKTFSNLRILKNQIIANNDGKNEREDNRDSSKSLRS